MTETDLDAYCHQHQPRFVDELMELLRIPSVSADPAHRGDVALNAVHIAGAARDAGFTSVEVIGTDGHPAVLADYHVDNSLPTALIYGHHDVQPVDPLEEWLSPPFEPTLRDGALFGRGAVDDKGQVWMHLKAVEAHTRARGRPPINLRLIVEGEEEIGSTHFDTIVADHRDRLAADVAVISDTAMLGPGVPSLCTGLRGLVGFEVEVKGPSSDLHSGGFGGAVANPAEMLARMLVGLRDTESGRVTVPGFYDRVVEPSSAERAAWAALPFTDAEFLAEAGDIPEAAGEAGWSILERRWVRPSLDINGIWGGYSGPGWKTIIPARAGAKLSCRLVPHQDPDDIAEKVLTALRAAAPRGVTVTLQRFGGGRPVVTPSDHPAVAAASRAMEHVFGRAPVLIRSGGSIPPVEILQRLLGIPSVLVGLGLPDDRIHAPNEKFDLHQFALGVRVIARLWDELAAGLTSEDAENSAWAGSGPAVHEPGRTRVARGGGPAHRAAGGGSGMSAPPVGEGGDDGAVGGWARTGTGSPPAGEGGDDSPGGS
ncbi:MAG: dipeptidase [Candidatus Dormibacteria bacterium]